MVTDQSQKIGFGLSCILDDEWSWSVERLRVGETTWGVGSEILAGACEYSKREAVKKIREELAKHGLTTETAIRLPF